MPSLAGTNDTISGEMLSFNFIVNISVIDDIQAKFDKRNGMEKYRL
jgi:hypothetical protein